MRDGRPNPDIWGNIITCGEIAVGIYEIVGTKKRGLEVPKAVAEDVYKRQKAYTEKGYACAVHVPHLNDFNTDLVEMRKGRSVEDLDRQRMACLLYTYRCV